MWFSAITCFVNFIMSLNLSVLALLNCRAHINELLIISIDLEGIASI